MTMSLVQTVTVGAGGAASIQFTGIPQTGQDLMVVLSVRNTTGSPNSVMYMKANGTDVNGIIRLGGNGVTATSSFSPFDAGDIVASGATPSTFSNTQVYISNYNSTVLKSYSVDSVTENNASGVALKLGAGNTGATAAITSLAFRDSETTNFVQYSTASLYTISTTGATGATVA